MSLDILLVARSLPVHAAGGLESAAWDLARRFARSGHSSTVLTTAHPDLPADSIIDGVRVRCVAAPPGRYSDAWWRGSAEIFREDYANTADVVLGVSAAANALVRHRNRSGGPVFVFQAHGTSSGEIVSKLRQRTPKAYVGLLRNLYWLLFKDRVYQDFDAVVAIGEAVFGQLAHWPTNRLLGRTPAVMISNGVDTNQFAFDPAARARVRAALSLPEQAKVVLSLCRLHPQKGLEVGLRAFQRAHAQDCDLRYLIAGEGPQRQELEALTAALGLTGKVLLLGGASRPDVAGYLSASDAFLFPTLRVEGLPITLLEALANGLPVITTPNGGDAELPSRRVPPLDVEATARAILETPANPQARVSLLPDRYTLDHSGRQYVALFEKLLAASGSVISDHWTGGERNADDAFGG